MDFKNLFKNKRITLMGLGLLGRGIGDAAFLAEAGAILTVTDLKDEKQLAASLESLKKFKNIRFVLGRHELADFRPAAADMVIKAAGVPLNSPFILEAEKTGVPVVMSTALFAEYTPADVVGVTGTRGKSTVTYLLYEILKAHKGVGAEKGSGKTSAAGKVFLGGNVLGVSTLEFLPQTSPGDVAVLELDSWQLQGFATKTGAGGFSPRVAVFTTFMPDHMNYYSGDMARYFADKANIYRFQSAADSAGSGDVASANVLVVSEQVAGFIRQYGPAPKAKMIIARPSDVPEAWKIKIPGEHNRLNIALALAAAQAMGVPEKTIQKVVESFRAVPGRLELIRTLNGVEIFNDTNATTPDATIVGLKALAGAKTAATAPQTPPQTVLIFGGADKKLDPSPLLQILPEYAKALVVLPGTGTDLIRSDLENLATKMPVVFVKSMTEAVAAAAEQAAPGDRILLSPAFASFGLFKNEYDRGDQFNAAVAALTSDMFNNGALTKIPE